MLILEGTSGNSIGRNVAMLGGFSYSAVESKIFPDGESHIKIPKSDEKSVAIVQSAYAPQDKHILELFFMADGLRERGCEKIIAIIPYLAYARQNKRFKDDDVVGMSTVMRLLKESGVGTVITVEPHRYEAMKMFNGRSVVVDVSEAISKAMMAETDKPVILSPDKGGVERAKKVAGFIGCEYDYVEKERNYDTGAVSTKGPISKDLRGKDVVIVDDVISTGGTIEQAASMAREAGAARVIAAAAHLVMAGNAYERILSSGVSALYGTNTIPYGKAKTIDISEHILKALLSL